MQTIRRGEVWWVNFDPAQGGEIRKTRPAVIVSNDLSNTHLIPFPNHLCLGVKPKAVL